MKAERIDVGQSPTVRVSVPQERRMPVCIRDNFDRFLTCHECLLALDIDGSG